MSQRLIEIVTERARKLRAQYALQVQSLGTRIGLRVNRIPQQLRTTRIGDLLEKYAQAAENGKKPVTKAPAVAASLSKLASKRAPVPIAKAQPVTANATSPRGLKRKR